MTDEKTTPRNPVAKEIATNALEVAQETAEALGQVRTELTELRTKVNEGGTAAGGGAELETINREFNEFVEFVNNRFSAIGDASGVVAIDTAPVQPKLDALEKKVGESFTAFAQRVDEQNRASTAAVEELREQMSSVADLAYQVAGLSETVRLFDEAGMPSASAEDVSALDQRLRALEVGEALADDRFNTRVLAQEIAAAHDAKTPRIYAQVHELMRLVTELGKDKKADAKMGGYQFRSIDAAMDAVGHALREVGVMFQPREILHQRIERYETVSKDGYRQNWTHVWVTQRYAFVSLIDGSEMSAIEMDGEARDNGDKSTSKADSMRLKYALLQSLMIPVNGLPESDGRDGTEGGQVYGRGSAGDAFDNATPARPDANAAAEGGTPPEQTPTPYGYGHQTADSPGGQAHAQAQQEPPADERTPEEKATAAYHALVALAGFEKPEQRPRLDKILRGIQAAGIGEIVIQRADGQQSTLHQYAATVNAQVGV